MRTDLADGAPPLLIGSAGTLEGLTDLIRKRWTWESVTFLFDYKSKAPTWVVFDAKGLECLDLRVIYKAGRYRLERVIHDS